MGALADPIDFETSEDGTIAAGAIKISFYNNGTGEQLINGVMQRVGPDAIVNGVPLRVGKATNFGFAGKPYKAIEYKTNGTTLFIRRTI